MSVCSSHLRWPDDDLSIRLHDEGASSVITALIVDDERLAREGVCAALKRENDVEIVGEAADGPAAVEAIGTLAPDVVFLDIRMPGLNGFEVL
jgi:two-component system LytT family response regulator